MTHLPRGWCQCTVGDVVSYVTSGSRDWSKYYSKSGVLFVRTQDINTNRVGDIESIALVSLPANVEGKRTRIFRDDLLITITGANVGKCAHVSKELPEAYVSQSVALVRLQNTSLARFVHYQLIAPSIENGKTTLEQSAYGLGRPVLNLDNVRNVPLRLAPLPEQHRIVTKIDGLSSKSRCARESVDHIPRLAEKYKQAILEAAFRGELTKEWRKTIGVSNKTSEFHALPSEFAGSLLPHTWNASSIGLCAINHDGRRVPVRRLIAQNARASIPTMVRQA